MKKLTGNEIIKMYIDYFKSLGHTEIESASLIPYNDKSLLWINAGVTPLKKFLDGSEVPVSRRLVSVQKCIRTGDIESVGRTARHHTSPRTLWLSRKRYRSTRQRLPRKAA